MEKLKNVKVIIDVGARDTTYPEDYPKAECHLFEPNRIHFQKLIDRFKGNPKVILNNYGLSDVDDILPYDPWCESFIVGQMRDYMVKVHTLDWYIDMMKIKRIDLLKIDAEAMDFRILQGGVKAILMAKNIQYEYWENKQAFEDLLGHLFILEDIGERNVFCTRK